MGGIGSGRKKATPAAVTKVAAKITNNAKAQPKVVATGLRGRLPKWAETPMKKQYVLDCRANGVSDYSEATFKDWRKEVNARKKIDAIKASVKKSKGK